MLPFLHHKEETVSNITKNNSAAMGHRSNRFLLVFSVIASCAALNNFDVPKAGLLKSMMPLPAALSASLVLGAAMSCKAAGCSCGSLTKCTCQERNSDGSDSTAWYNPAYERIYDTLHQSYIPALPEKYLPKDLRRKRVIAIGEVHSNPCHHKLEFEIIKSLTKSQTPSNIAIGLECFYRQHQKALDRFVFMHKDLGLLKYETDWDNTWGYDLNYYAKIFNFAAQNGVRLLGLNMPIQVAKLVSEMGLDNLPESLRKLLPEVDLSVEKHKDLFRRALSIGGHDIKDVDKFERLYETQVLWEEYMSETVSSYVSQFPHSTIVVIAGLGHIIGRVAIPDRIQKRTGLYPFVIVPQQVDWSKETGLPLVDSPVRYQDADWAWYTQKEIVTARSN